MQSRDGQIDRNPHFLLLVAQQESLLRMKNSGFLVGMTETLKTALKLRAKQIGDLQVQQFRPRKSAQPLGHGVHVAYLFRLRIEQEERIPRFLEEGHRQFIAGVEPYGVISRSHVNSSTLSIQILPCPPK